MTPRAEHREIARLRAASQGIFPRCAPSPAGIVERLLAVQAQDLPAAKWAVGARVDGSTLETVDAAINAGSIVRSWPMRGTLHLVPGRDLGWMLALTTQRLLRQAATTHARLGLDEGLLERCRELAHSALAGGHGLTRRGFQASLDEVGIDTSGGRGYHIIWYLAQTGTLCWGPTSGAAQQLVLLQEWVPNPRALDRDEALGEFFLRYIAGHGPATLADFAGWGKLTVADAKRGLAVAGSRLVAHTVDDTVYYLTAESAGEASDAALRRRFAESVALLPAFDEYFLGYRDRELAADPEHHELIVPGKNGVFQPIIVAGGRVVGTWRRRVRGAGTPRAQLQLSPEPFAGLSRGQQAGVRRAALRYARFLGLPLHPEDGG